MDQPCGLNRAENKEGKILPRPTFTISQCVDLLKQGYKNVTEGSFAPAQASFLEILQTLPLISVEKKVQVSEVKELRGICADYITGLRLELERRQVTDPVRAASLACYFTQCKLQPVHTLLALRVAIKCAYAAKCFNVTGNLCRRTLEFAVSANTNNQFEKLVNFQQIRGVLKMCEKENTDASDLKFTEGAKLCCGSFEPIPKMTQSVSCPFCESVYLPQFEGTVCVTCNLSKVGGEATGLRCFAE
jgi:coatomer protein complex subunit alpha (xenin)